jgi:hypothetical protein
MPRATASAASVVELGGRRDRDHLAGVEAQEQQRRQARARLCDARPVEDGDLVDEPPTDDRVQTPVLRRAVTGDVQVRDVPG